MTRFRLRFLRDAPARPPRRGLTARAAFIRFPAILTVSLFWFISSLPAQVPVSVYNQVIADLNQEKYADAEATLKPALNEHPRDAEALGLMGVILDAQKRYTDAEGYYQRGLRLSPSSPTFFNNLGNHYLAQSELEPATNAYRKVVEINPHDRNADLQLANICFTKKQGREALHYLAQLAPEDQASPNVLVLRAQALKLTGDSSAAERQLLAVLDQFGGDPRVSFSVGMLFAEWKSYRQAEGAFAKAQQAAPGNFDVLYNLGLAALEARDGEQAGQALHLALHERPDDVDCLIGLARAEDMQGHDDKAAEILFRSVQLAPNHPDVLKFLAGVTAKLGLYGVAASTYANYLKLHPEDEEARREHAYNLFLARKLAAPLSDLNDYAQKHPHDPVGIFEIGMAESIQHPDRALQNLNQALALDPHMTSARLERAHLLEHQGRVGEAEADLKMAAASNPNDFHAWDELGKCYLDAGRTEDALESMKRAVDLAPQDSVVLIHYSQVLMRAGQQDSARSVLARLKSRQSKEGPQGIPVRRRDDFSLELSLRGMPDLAALREIAAADPHDVQLQLRLGKELLSTGVIPEALEIFQRIKTSASDPRVLAECGRALTEAGEYKPAREFLSQALAADSGSAQTRFDLVIAVFHDAGAESALAELDQSASADQKGDYFLLRAQLLDALGKTADAAEALNRGFRFSPTRADLYFQAALFLIKHGQTRQMIDLLTQADHVVPDDPQLLLTRAMGYEMLREHEPALAQLTRLESKWPKWYLPYLIQGIILSIRIHPLEAIPVLQLAIALGADDAVTYFYLASALIDANTENVAEAQEAIDAAVALDPDDPFAQSLAGKIAYLGKNYPLALQHLGAALKIWPDMVEAHETRSATYRALGEKEKSVDDLKEVLRIKQQMPTADQSPPFPIGSELFGVRSPDNSNRK
ncbi:MAG: tetratricopeptide repeat protein [Terriglobia bacterium]